MASEDLDDISSTVPLSLGQRTRLLADCLPLVTLTVMVAAFQLFWVPMVGGPNPVFYLVMAVALAVTGYDAMRRVQDLQAGVARVSEDVLTRTGRSRRPGGGAFWGTFERLGRMRLTADAFSRSANGARHRIIYSPASRLVWSVEPLRPDWRDRQST